MNWKKLVMFWKDDKGAKLLPKQEGKKAIIINLLEIFKKEKK